MRKMLGETGRTKILDRTALAGRKMYVFVILNETLLNPPIGLFSFSEKIAPRVRHNDY